MGVCDGEGLVRCEKWVSAIGLLNQSVTQSGYIYVFLNPTSSEIGSATVPLEVHLDFFRFFNKKV